MPECFYRHQDFYGFYRGKVRSDGTLIEWEREGITSPRPTAPGPIYFFTGPGPNYFFTAPNNGITFSQPPTSKITFSRPLVTTIVCHVFFYSFKQNSTYSLFKNSFQQNVLSYTNQLRCASIGCFFI